MTTDFSLVRIVHNLPPCGGWGGGCVLVLHIARRATGVQGATALDITVPRESNEILDFMT